MLRSLARRFGRRNSTDRRARPKTARPHLGVEALEDRWVPATFQIIDSVLTYTAGAGVANNLTVSFSNGTYTFTDTDETTDVLGVPGASGSGTTSVTFPGSQVPPGGIAIHLGDMNDRLTIESSAHAIAVKGGNGHDTIDVGKAAGGNLGLVGAPVSVDGEADTDFLRLNDQQSNVLASYTITADKVTRSVVPVLDVNYADTEYLTINAGLFADTFHVRSTAANTRTTLNGGENNDTFNVGSTTNTLDDIQSTLFLHGGAQGLFGTGDQVNFLDQGSSARAYTFRTDNFLACTGSAMIGYSGMEQLTLSTGDFADAVAVVGTSSGTAISLNLGGGDDQVTLGTSVNSLDTFAPKTPVTVNSEAGNDSITLYDQVDDNGNAYVLTATQLTRNFNQMILNYADAESLTLNAGNFDDTVTVRSINSYWQHGIYLNLGGDDDSVLVQAAAQPFEDLFGTLRVNGQGGTDQLTFDDRGAAAGSDLITIYSHVVYAGSGTFYYTGMEGLTVNLASVPTGEFTPANYVYAVSTSVPTTINGAPYLADYFVVGDLFTFGSSDGIQGALTLNGQDGVDSLVMWDLDDNGNSYTITSTSVVRSGAALISFDLANTLGYTGRLEIMTSPFDDVVTVSSTEATLPVKLYMGDGNDTVTLDGGGPSPLAGPVTLYMGYGNDTVTLGGGPDRLAGFASPVTVYGQEGLDDIVVNNAADPGPAPFFGSMYWITSTDVELNERLLLTYDTAESLAINAGSGNDGIWVTSTRAETPVVFRAGAGSDTFLVGWTNPAQVAGAVTLDGQGGTDLLDYWWYFEDVRVNLALGTATRVAGGISNIEKVHGGWGNDIIVGNDMANTLYGGPGRDILIGRGGADVVAGQSSDDILIGGSTVHDLIPARLEDLMREWSRTDLEGGAPSQYQARVYHLQGVSGGLNGTTILDLSTVIDDGAADSLHGEADLDWFFQFGADVIASLDNWEHVN